MLKTVAFFVVGYLAFCFLQPLLAVPASVAKVSNVLKVK